MKDSRIVTALHPNSTMRILLRSMLQDPGRTVITDHSWTDLLADSDAPAPDVLLLDPSFIGQDDVDVPSLLHERWPHAEVVVLPPGLDDDALRRDAMIRLLRTVDDLLNEPARPG